MKYVPSSPPPVDSMRFTLVPRHHCGPGHAVSDPVDVEGYDEVDLTTRLPALRETLLTVTVQAGDDGTAWQEVDRIANVGEERPVSLAFVCPGGSYGGPGN